MTERLHFHFSLSCIWQGNGHPLQCSWLENPRDGGAWWAVVSSVRSSRLTCLVPCNTFSERETAAAAARSLQLCPNLCDPIDSSPAGSPIPGILQPRTPEWVAISFSNAWKWKVKVKLLSRVWLLAYQAPPSMGFSRQEYWSGVPWPFLKLFDYALLI